MRPVAIVQHEPSVPSGSIAGVLHRLGLEHFVVEAWREDAWPATEDVGAVVVMGGTMNADQVDDYPFLGRTRALLSGALEGEVPVLGVCLGSQLMSRVLGGDVIRAPSRNAFFSTLDVPAGAAADPVIAPFAGGVPVLQFHEDTFSLPPGATALARSSESGLLQAFRYGDNAYAVQFHFEVDESILWGWCRNIGDAAMEEEWGVSTADLMDQARRSLDAQDRAGRRLTEAFLVRAGLAPAPEREAAGPRGPGREAVS